VGGLRQKSGIPTNNHVAVMKNAERHEGQWCHSCLFDNPHRTGSRTGTPHGGGESHGARELKSARRAPVKPKATQIWERFLTPVPPTEDLRVVRDQTARRTF
jgi:hypothetical protein